MYFILERIVSKLRPLLFVLIWFIFTDEGIKTEWYIELIEHNNSITKVKRCDYLEYKSLIDDSIPNSSVVNLMSYYRWENDYKNLDQEPKKTDYGQLWQIRYDYLVRKMVKDLNKNML